MSDEDVIKTGRDDTAWPDTIMNPVPRPKNPELWRERWLEKNKKLTSEVKGDFLWELSRCGLKTRAAELCGISVQVVEQTSKEEKEFASAMTESLEEYASWLQNKARGQFVEGLDTYKVNKGEVVMHNGKEVIEKVFPNNPMMQMELKRVNPAYREKTEIDLNVQSAVLVAPSLSKVQDWISKNAKIQADEE